MGIYVPPRGSTVPGKLRVVAGAALLSSAIVIPGKALAVPSFARQTGFPCAQCHTLAFGPALTPYGRQFKLTGYTAGKGEHPMPVALMMQGGFSHTEAAQPQAPAPHYATNDNLSVDQVSLFLATRLTEHVGLFSQATYSGEQRHFSWDNTDLRYARLLSLFGTDEVAGISINNNPTVQDLWNSTPAWGFPYITSPLLPSPSASPVISGALAQLVLGATAYTMIHEQFYLEGGMYRGLSDRWLNNVGLYSTSNPHVQGVAPYWRAAYQRVSGSRYFSLGTFGMNVRMQSNPSIADTDRFTDIGFDAVYQLSGEGDTGVLANASYIHERQDLEATFRSGGSMSPSHHLDVLKVDASYVYRQTLSAGAGVFDTKGDADPTFYSPAPLTGSASGAPASRGYILQFEYVPFGKKGSWAAPWVNVRLGVQYTGYVRFNGGTSNYDAFGRSSRQNNSLFMFVWAAF